MHATVPWRPLLAVRFFVVGALAAALVVPALTARADDRANSIASYATVLRSFNAHFSQGQSRDIAEHVILLSSYYSLDPRLLIAIVGVESGWRPDAVSPAGAEGLGQLMPATASGLGVLAFEQYENLDGTARYLRRLLNQYAAVPLEKRYQLALAGYNAGPEAVKRYGGIPPYAETRTYVTRVMSLWHEVGTELAESAPKNIAQVPVLPVAPTPSVELPPVKVADPPPEVAPKPHPVAVAVRPVPPRPIPSGPISSIALIVPMFVTDGQPIPVTMRTRGSGMIELVAKIGPRVIERRMISSAVGRVLLRALSPMARTRLVTLQATAAGVRSHEIVVAAVGPARSISATP